MINSFLPWIEPTHTYYDNDNCLVTNYHYVLDDCLVIVWLMTVWWLYFSLGWKLSHKISWLLNVTMHDEWWLKDGPFWSRTWGLLKFVKGSKSKEFCGVFDDGETTPPWTKSPRSGQNEDEKYPEFIAKIKCQIDFCK